MARLKEKFLGLKSELQADLGIKNPMQVPALEKVVISVGAGFAMKDNKLIKNIEDTITKIAGQKATTVIAKKSVAGFKVREGMPVTPQPVKKETAPSDKANKSAKLDQSATQ